MKQHYWTVSNGHYYSIILWCIPAGILYTYTIGIIKALLMLLSYSISIEWPG